MLEGLMWESEQHLTCVWPQAASRHGQCTHTSADGMDALQTHLVQLVHCLEPCSLVALVGTSAHDGGHRIDRHCAGRVHVLGGDRREEQGAEEDRQLHCVPAHDHRARAQSRCGSLGGWGMRVWCQHKTGRVCETAALVRARERAWRRAAQRRRRHGCVRRRRCMACLEGRGSARGALMRVKKRPLSESEL